MHARSAAEWDTWVRVIDAGADQDEVVARFANFDIPRRHLMRLRFDPAVPAKQKWLSDELVNGAMALLGRAPGAERSRFFQSFFVPKLYRDGRAYDYDAVRRWSKNEGDGWLDRVDRILVPVNIHDTHWACALIDLADRRLKYYDSMGVSISFRMAASRHPKRNRGPPAAPPAGGAESRSSSCMRTRLRRLFSLDRAGFIGVVVDVAPAGTSSDCIHISDAVETRCNASLGGAG